MFRYCNHVDCFASVLFKNESFVIFKIVLYMFIPTIIYNTMQ